MLNGKKALTLTGILILVSIAIFLMSHQTPPETVVTYKAVEFTPKTEKRTPSASHPTSDVETDALANEDRDGSAPHTDDAIESTETALLLDELFFSEILDETEGETIVTEDAEIVEDDGYPEVPPDFPFSVVWKVPEAQRAEIPTRLFEELELMSKVMIKLWNEGDQGFSGAFMADGKVYPTYPDVAYVKWVQSEASGEWYINDVSTVHSYVSDQLLDGIMPPGIEIVDQDSAGIDPYAFLSQ
ncbi:hypothetical protein F4055_08360 [Candidatus Poribacteria bacterium]|nr:hypothetical protein [Candidatus Poribacteria bacterium]